MDQLKTALNYIHYRFTSKTPHGIHSPFVYHLLTEVIRDKKAYPCYKQIELLRSSLLLDTREVSITDLGAGSKSSKSSVRMVKALVRQAAKPARYAQLLFRLVNHFKPAVILELGTSLGISTLYLAAGNNKAQVLTIEGCPQIAALAKSNFTQAHQTHISLINGNFDAVLPTVIKEQQQLDFVFIDGNHRKQSTLDYFEKCLTRKTNTSVFVIDDIHWSAEMQQAWQQIKAHQEVTVSLDLFFMGIVFFRREQTKEHFVIRF